MNQPHPARPTVSSPLIGAYYWFPRPRPQGYVWDLVTCHDLGVADGISHREFWPHVLQQLALAWGKEPRSLKRRLSDHYTGLPRGRITHPRTVYFIIQGNDAPVSDWRARIEAAFHLNDVVADPLFDEHERMLRDDLRAVEEPFGISLGLDSTV